MSSLILFLGAGRPFEHRDEPLCAPAPGEALVRVTACTLCASDLHTWTGRRQEPIPLVLGHEIAGTVEALGETAPRAADGAELDVGDAIVWSVAASCGSCRPCRRGLPQKCDCLFKYGHARHVEGEGSAEVREAAVPPLDSYRDLLVSLVKR